VLEALNVPRDLSRSPLVQVAFAYHDALPATITMQDAVLAPDLPYEPAHFFDLQLVCWQSGDSLHGRLEYDSALFAESSMQRIAGYFQTLLASALAAPQSKLIDLRIMSD